VLRRGGFQPAVHGDVELRDDLLDLRPDDAARVAGLARGVRRAGPGAASARIPSVPSAARDRREAGIGVSAGITSPPSSPGGEGGGSEYGGLTLESVKRRLLRGSAWVTGGRMLSIALGILLNALLAHIL